ncbi:MAG: threonylcarbamoyl-AMP synthase [Zetaproteobacteria bacterium]|nr:MAG: threonylcarbamoyl-AMP synthase [Zetaproteobacteria bacterium]
MRVFERLRLHAERPQARQVRRAVELLRQGLFVVLPTDTTYVAACLPQANRALADIRQLRGLDQRHLWSLLCADLSQVAEYARMDNSAHRLLKRCLPGPYTFILPASSRLPRRIFGKRRDIGVRMPDHPVCRALQAECPEALLATTFRLRGEPDVEYDPDVFIPRIKHLNCAVMDAGWGGLTPTTVVDLCAGDAELVRAGAGPWPPA